IKAIENMINAHLNSLKINGSADSSLRAGLGVSSSHAISLLPEPQKTIATLYDTNEKNLNVEISRLKAQKIKMQNELKKLI
ncbi:MAG: hypothetical protein GY714_00685, partial [Desulfobacterales bacterium]|nr:hypothetical protein [Desulfobacterales bacterium]